MEIPLISKKRFNKIRKLFPTRKRIGRLDDRKVISAIILAVRYGLPWRQIPDFHGKWTSIYSRFTSWNGAEVIQKIFYAFAHKLPKRSTTMIDSTFSKAQRSASSTRSDGKKRELGRSSRGITTKIHFLCDSNAMPMDFFLTPGQVSDVKIAPILTDRSNAMPMDFFLTPGQVSDVKIAPILTDRNKMKRLIADKAYGLKAYRKKLEERHIDARIPRKSNEKNPAEYDAELYKTRHIIENMFSKLMDWHGIAFRGNRRAHSFHSFVAIGLIFTFFYAKRAYVFLKPFSQFHPVYLSQ